MHELNLYIKKPDLHVLLRKEEMGEGKMALLVKCKKNKRREEGKEEVGR